jgi:hypothetical protein
MWIKNIEKENSIWNEPIKKKNPKDWTFFFKSLTYLSLPTYLCASHDTKLFVHVHGSKITIHGQ